MEASTLRPRQAKSNALNKMTPPRKGPATPLLSKFNNLNINSPKVTSPLSGSDKENCYNGETYVTKRKSVIKSSAKKRLPLGESHQMNTINENEFGNISLKIRSSPRLSANIRQPVSSSPQKRTCDYLDFSDPEDFDYTTSHGSPKKRSNRRKSVSKSPRRGSKKAIDDLVYSVEVKSPMKLTLKRSTTPQRTQKSALGCGLEEEYESEAEKQEVSFGLEKEYEEDDDSDEVSDTSDDTIVSKKSAKTSKTKANDVETFEEEPVTSKLNIFLKSVSKLELEVMQEDITRQAELRKKRENNPLMQVYSAFHTSALPDVLLKREEQCKQIKLFIEHAVGVHGSVHNRSIYISGVPGTGKTACVTKVVQKLQKTKLKFNYVYVNGLELVKPQHIFSEIYSSLYPSSRKIAPKIARDKLAKIFTFDDKKRSPILLVVDELDMLCTKSQDVVYDIFDWSSTEEAKLSVIAIANTLDLPERVLKQRVSSRLGYNRLTFQPYTFEEIEHILSYRVKESKISFKDGSFGLIARKVASVSGDLRKALEFIRRAIEIAVEQDAKELTIRHAKAAIEEGLQSLPIHFTKSLSVHQECFLRSIVQEMRATSLEEVDYISVYDGYRRSCFTQAKEPVEMCQGVGILSSLKTTGYIDVKSAGLVHHRITLKSSIDEIDFLLRQIHLNGEN